ncbi:MAG: D-alanyl-D-alanine carboxypeptidase [Alphaproteobacteria bacterium]
MAIAASSPVQARYASLIVDEQTGQVLHARNADDRKYPASLTKIMTLYMAFDALKHGRLALSQKLPVSRRAAGMSPSKLGLKQGSTITVQDAIMALVTKSANDVAVVVAEALGGTEIRFAQDMTRVARQLGMTRTTFRNASGLPNRQQQTTARDMAKLATRIRQDFPGYFELFKTKSFTYNGRSYKNHNNLLSQYSGTDGIKTGYINASGFNLVATVERHGRRLIGVVFGGKTAKRRDRHMMKLLDTAFRKTELLVIRAPLRPSPELSSSIAVADAATAALNPFDNNTDKVVSAAPKAPEAPTPESFADGWSIQVGAFSNMIRARTAAHQARSRIGSAAYKTTIAIVPTKSNDPLLYRARLIGLSQDSATRACRMLTRADMPCVTVSPAAAAQLAKSE